MNAALEKTVDSEAYLAFMIEAEKIEEGLERSYKKNVKKYNVPGFRKGSAPRAILEAKFGQKILIEDALDFIVPDEYYAAVKELDLKTIGDPDIEVGHIVKGEPVKVTVRVPVKPEVKLGKLKELEIKVPQLNEVTDEDVENYLQNLRMKNEIVIDKASQPAAMGDTITIDYQCSVKDSKIKGKEENYKVVLGEDKFFFGFEENFVGVKKGAKLNIEINFPEDHPAVQLAGKNAVFKIKVKKVENIQLRELNDEFAQEVANLNSLEELYAETKKRLQEMAAMTALNMKKQAAIAALLNKYDFSVPGSLVLQHEQGLLEQFKQKLNAEGRSIEQYLKMTNRDSTTFQKELWEEAKTIVKTNFILDKIIEEKKFEVSDEELRSGIEAFGMSIGMDKENATKENLGPLVNKVLFDLKADKAVQYVLDQAVITVDDTSNRIKVNLQE